MKKALQKTLFPSEGETLFSPQGPQREECSGGLFLGLGLTERPLAQGVEHAVHRPRSPKPGAGDPNRMAAKKTTAAAAKKAPAAKKEAKEPAAAKKAPAKKAAAAAGGRKPNAAFMKEMTPSAALAEVVGNKPLPRTAVVSKIWEYIKKNNLQDAKNKRQINADDKLKPIFGGKKSVTMFELTALVNKNLS